VASQSPAPTSRRWGYRFHLSGDLAGRVEINYTMFKQNTDLSRATNTVGLMVGAAMPLK